MKGRSTGGRVRGVGEGSRCRRVAQTCGKAGDEIIYISGVRETQTGGHGPEHGQNNEGVNTILHGGFSITRSPGRDAVKACEAN